MSGQSPLKARPLRLPGESVDKGSSSFRVGLWSNEVQPGMCGFWSPRCCRGL
jgi:hypothetical protein